MFMVVCVCLWETLLLLQQLCACFWAKPAHTSLERTYCSQPQKTWLDLTPLLPVLPWPCLCFKHCALFQLSGAAEIGGRVCS